ncbi:MAG: histidine phosphotransferase family protein, partial [Pseudomonadota bacterium]
MHPTDDHLASLIGSRICHDLISPIGAVTNGLELLELTGLPSSPEMDLVNQSAHSAAARIKYYRLAFGDFGHIDAAHPVRGAEIVSILEGVFISGRIEANWHVIEDRPRAEMKAALLALMCAEVALGSGGRIDVTLQDDTWTVDAKGPKLMLEGDPWRMLSGQNKDAKIAPAAVQFAILPGVLDLMGRTLSMSTSEDVLTLR